MHYARGLGDLVQPDDLLAMSGLEFMTGMLEGRLPAPPISRIMGYGLHAVERGRVVFRGTPEFDVTNPTGTVHGGWYGTLLDSAMACAVMINAPPMGRRDPIAARRDGSLRWSCGPIACAR